MIKGVPKIVERVNERNSDKLRHGDSVIACLLGIYARAELGEKEQVDYKQALKSWGFE